MSEISVKMSEICYQIRLVYICASKLLDEALLVSHSLQWRHWQLLSITDILLTVSAIGITKRGSTCTQGVHNYKSYTISVTLEKPCVHFLFM